MISPAAGVVFTTAVDGDMRRDRGARGRLGGPAEWATVRQVHGAEVIGVTAAGEYGEADGLFTATPGVALAVFTADCLGVVVTGADTMAVVHAGWRGIAAGVVDRAVARVGEVRRAHVGPHIRSCCFEVGPEVAERFPAQLGRTSWGTVSVDLAAAVSARIPVDTEVVDLCTRCGTDTFSHRRDATRSRLATVGWVA